MNILILNIIYITTLIICLISYQITSTKTLWPPKKHKDQFSAIQINIYFQIFNIAKAGKYYLAMKISKVTFLLSKVKAENENFEFQLMSPRHVKKGLKKNF